MTRRSGPGAILSVLVGFLAWSTVVTGQVIELRVEAPPALQPLADRVRAMDIDAMARALDRAGLDLPPRVHITLIPNDDPRARATSGWIVAQAFGTDSFIIFPARVSSYPYESLEGVVLHEIVHLALTVKAGAALPRWFHEGVAVSVETGWGLGSEMRLLWAAARGPAIDDVGRLFESSSQPDTAAAYLLAAALVEDIRSRHGPAVPGAIAAHVAKGTSFERAFWIETGDTVDEAAARAWVAYRGWSHWLPFFTSPSALWSWILVLAFVAFAVRVHRRRTRRRQWGEEEEESEEAGEP